MPEWRTVKIPRALAEAIDAYLQTPEAALHGYKSRSDLITQLVAEWVKRRQGPRTNPTMHDIA